MRQSSCGTREPKGRAEVGDASEHVDESISDDAELAYAEMLADDGADFYEVRVRCRWARTRRSR